MDGARDARARAQPRPRTRTRAAMATVTKQQANQRVRSNRVGAGLETSKGRVEQGLETRLEPQVRVFYLNFHILLY
jgi:hypothetical protein